MRTTARGPSGRDSILDVPGVAVGSAEDPQAATGCTAVLFARRATCGVDVRGGATGTRELALLEPTAAVDAVDAILLTGGSAFGLDAAAGVVRFLEERGRGYRAGDWTVPIVPAAVLFDLALGDGTVRPDRDMGYAAAANAGARPFRAGNAGAGCGATVGKRGGMDRAMKGGLGSAARTTDDGVTIGALVAVNALGDVRDPATGTTLAGRRDGDAERPRADVPPGTNTTLAVIAVDANLTKAQATFVARMAHDGFARAIAPAHTTRDGDVIFAAATGGRDVAVDAVGIVAAELVAEAIVRAVLAARTIGTALAHVDACDGRCPYGPHERESAHAGEESR